MAEPTRGHGTSGTRRRASAALTLIELLVTVAIIAVLAATLLPEFLAYQTRAKVAASKGKLRVLADAIDVYRLDNQAYPFPQTSPDDPYGIVSHTALRCLTTPVAYVGRDAFRDAFGTLQVQVPFASTASRAFDDPFRPPSPGFNTGQSMLYFYYPCLSFLIQEPVPPDGAFSVASVGPDLKDSFIVYYPFPHSLPSRAGSYGIYCVADSVYDPTNGALSGGDLAAFGGALSLPRFVGGGE